MESVLARVNAFVERSTLGDVPLAPTETVSVLKGIDAAVYMLQVIEEFGSNLYVRGKLVEFKNWLPHALPKDYEVVTRASEAEIADDSYHDVIEAAERLASAPRATFKAATRPGKTRPTSKRANAHIVVRT